MKTGKKEQIKKEIIEFQNLMEESFPANVAINEKVISKFKSTLIKKGFTDDDIRSRYSSFIWSNYKLRDHADMKMPLYNNRDIALKIHAEVFHEYFEKDFASIPNKQIIMDLCGILFFKNDTYDNQIDKISNSEFPVLITGETGTGKELYAKAIHYLSAHRKDKYLPINCAGLQESMLENELFGHKKGAFTDATSDEIGLLEEVGEGTVFLDEIAEIPMALQAKLLRVLESRDFRRIGDTQIRHFKGRVIAATNKDLKVEIRNKKFREDLFYRLNVLELKLPPLRKIFSTDEKKMIITMIASNIKANFTSDRWQWRWLEYDEEVSDSLLKYDYPGNFRELTNILIRALTLSQGGPIKMEHLPDEVKNFHSDRTVADTPPEKKESTTDVKLVDIFDYADSVTTAIIKSKIEEIYEGGHELKKVIQTEMRENFTDSNYQTLRNKLEKVLGGKGQLKKIRDKYKRH